MAGLTLTEREMLVLRSVLRRYRPKSISGDVWTEIAAEANITNGVAGRNARNTFDAVLKRLGDEKSVGGSGASACAKPKGVKKSVAKPRGQSKKKAEDVGKILEAIKDEYDSGVATAEEMDAEPDHHFDAETGADGSD